MYGQLVIRTVGKKKGEEKTKEINKNMDDNMI
jgi:hypothetical protein